MDAENIAKLIAPNVYPDEENAQFDLERLTRTIKFMIKNYPKVFSETISYLEGLYKEGEATRQTKKETEDIINSCDDIEETPVSEALQYENTDKVELTLKDIVKQGEVEVIDNGQFKKRWFVLKKNSLLIFNNKNINEAPLSLFFMKGSKIKKDKLHATSISFTSGTRTYTFKFQNLDDMKLWKNEMKELS